MQQSALSTIGLPLALAIIMLGLGLHLRLDDFRRILKQPKAMLVGLACQALLLPALCLGLSKLWGLPGSLAVGMMLLAASPGGITANLYSHLFKGDVALNISLTAINSVTAIVSIPLIVNFSLLHFMGNQQVIPLQFQKTLEVMLLILLPVGLGMLVHARFPAFAQRMDKPVKIASALVLVLMILLILQREWALVVANFQQVGSAALVFNLASLLVGYGAGQLARLSEGQSRAIAFEIGIHNGTLAIYLALAVLNDGGMAIPAAIYSLLMFCTAALFGFWVARKG
ncbi:bile acid:sodium symporter family protein [Pelomonas sp. SE-A7]|uniref:bile acid:sodium symporter family protein n=1 Tax=Pelomonas sp. SE-A7 TaxID=3054953 RepID=UPI00259D01F8|nr:bile acid:sodium symporter family protein [Pelomonas sp. SE-A7]MDM4765270.1 bile acid:sodium symporter family protein [Pelomonas sp. SE-A7]